MHLSMYMCARSFIDSYTYTLSLIHAHSGTRTHTNTLSNVHLSRIGTATHMHIVDFLPFLPFCCYSLTWRFIRPLMCGFLARISFGFDFFLCVCYLFRRYDIIQMSVCRTICVLIYYYPSNANTQTTLLTIQMANIFPHGTMEFDQCFNCVLYNKCCFYFI